MCMWYTFLYLNFNLNLERRDERLATVMRVSNVVVPPGRVLMVSYMITLELNLKKN